MRRQEGRCPPIIAQFEGGFRVFDGDAEVTTTKKKVAAVLAFLTYARGESIERKRLIRTFWASSPPKQGQASLRQALAEIRRTVGRDVLVATPKSVAIDPERIAVSTHEVWTPDGFMRGFEDAWVRDIRNRLRAGAGATVGHLSTGMPSGAAEAAVQWVNYVASVDPKIGVDVVVASREMLRQLRTDDAVHLLAPLDGEANDPEAEVSLLLLLSCVFSDRGRSDIAVEYSHRAFQLADQHGLTSLVSKSGEYEVLATLELGNLARAREAVTRVKEYCGGSVAEFAEALFWVQADDVTRARRSLRRSRDMAIDEGNPFKAQMALLNWAAIDKEADTAALCRQYGEIPCDNWPWSPTGRILMGALEARRSGRAQEAFLSLDNCWRGFADHQKYRLAVSILSHFLGLAEAASDYALQARVLGGIVGLRDRERVTLCRNQRKVVSDTLAGLRSRFDGEDLRNRLHEGARLTACAASLL